MASIDYDTVPYPGHPHAATHPNRVAAIARLYGMRPAPVATARILEIGCGDGGNLVPLAASLPRSRCVGFDLAAGAVARARQRIARLGLANVDIEVADLARFEPSTEYDYVIAHGVYSWVEPAVRDKLLRLVAASLGRDGVAFVSYNVYPGWHVAGMVREMMRYHTRGCADAAAQVEQARALLHLLAAAHDAGDAYGALLAAECARIAGHGAGHLLHDDLAATNDPVYFHEFVAHAARFGLAFVAEADFATMSDADVPEPARGRLEGLLGDPVQHGQYLDFVRCRRFRESLLRRADAPADGVLRPDRIRMLLAASAARPDAMPVDFAAGVETQFRCGERASLKTDHPLAKAALLALNARWPQAMPFDELLAAARARLGSRPPAPDDAEALEQILLGAFALRMVELTADPWRCAARAGERPRAGACAQFDAVTGDTVTTLAHRRARIDEPLALRLLALCDGSRDAAALAAALAIEGFDIDADGLRQRLDAFVRMGLLEG
jgi:hypothetical protein